MSRRTLSLNTHEPPTNPYLTLYLTPLPSPNLLIDPPGNYVSNWHWQDCVGPIHLRPKRVELAWLSTESNVFGLNEFVDYARGLGVEP